MRFATVSLLLPLLAPACGEPAEVRLPAEIPELAFPVRGPRASAIRAERAFAALQFERPTLIAHVPDGSQRMVVGEQGGRLLAFANRPDVASADVFLDLRDAVFSATGECGLIGLAFAPDFASSGVFYVDYTAADPLRVVVARFRTDPARTRGLRDSEQVLLEIPEPSDQHNGGQLAFGPDGMLYVGVGDGSDDNDAAGNAQDLGSLLGKILRLDVRGGAAYRVPADNPFVGRPGARPEIWAYGLRNPWRFSFDPRDGTLWCGDVGHGREEIDHVARGRNYGWSGLEGTRPFRGAAPAGATPPVHEYDLTVGSAVIGGLVYRGTAIAALRDGYLYGDYVAGTIRALSVQGGRAVRDEPVATAPLPRSFGEDEAGTPYLVLENGEVRRLVEGAAAADDAAPFPQRLSETGLFADTARLRAAVGVHGYSINASSWADGAVRRRFVCVPEPRRIAAPADGPWSLPRDTVLVEHIELPTRAGRVRVETRVLVHEVDGWFGYSYRWNDAQTDAVLIDGGVEARFAVADPQAPGGVREQVWYFPTRAECLQCHTDAAGRVLGIGTAQLHREVEVGGRAVDQLALWARSDLLREPLPPPGSLRRRVDPFDPSEPLAERVAAYLATNCGHCHRPGGPSALDLLGDLAALRGSRPMRGDLGVPDARIVAPGNRERSVLWQRLRRLDRDRMPPLGRNLVDARGVELIGTWIDAQR